MKILVTGGNGFIGSQLLRSLLLAGYEVVLLKRSTSNLSRIKDSVANITSYDWDKEGSLATLLKREKIQTVLHLASCYVKADTAMAERDNMYQTNVTLAKELLDASITAKVHSFINTGTFFEFAPSNQPLNENSKKIPFNYYAETKIEFEKYLSKMARTGKIKGTTLRPFSPYGPGDQRTVIYLMIQALLLKQPFLLGNSSQVLSFTYIEDIVGAYLKAIAYLTTTSSSDYEDFNIGSSQAYSVKEIGEFLEKIARQEGNILQYRTGEISQAICDNGKANRLLYWKPAIDIFGGLTKTYQYHLAKGQKSV